MIQTPWHPLDWDMNGDGAFTITDIGLWLQYAFFVPGDWIIWACLQYWPEMSQFLEIDTSVYGSTFSALISVFGWLIIIVVLMVTSHFLAEADRAVTRALRTVYTRMAIKIRIAKRLVGESLRRRRDRIRALLNSGAQPELTAEELRVLKAHAYVKPPATLALSDLVRATGVPRMQVMEILLRLRDLDLLVDQNDSVVGERAYALTQPGRQLLGFEKLRARSA